jgi:hypothetical protein
VGVDQEVKPKNIFELVDGILSKYPERNLRVKRGYIGIPPAYGGAGIFIGLFPPVYYITQGRIFRRKVAKIYPGSSDILLFSQEIRDVVYEIVAELQSKTKYRWNIYPD